MGYELALRSTISMFIETAKESKEQLNIKRFKLALEELEMVTKTLNTVNGKIMSATNVEHIKQEIMNTRKESFKLKFTVMEPRNRYQRDWPM